MSGQLAASYASSHLSSDCHNYECTVLLFFPPVLQAFVFSIYLLSTYPSLASIFCAIVNLLLGRMYCPFNRYDTCQPSSQDYIYVSPFSSCLCLAFWPRFCLFSLFFFFLFVFPRFFFFRHFLLLCFFFFAAVGCYFYILPFLLCSVSLY